MEPDLLIIRPGAAEPIYRQIVEQLRRLIVSAQLRPGEELPSVRDVAGHHAINPMTVSRAYSQLETEGLLQRRRGKGMAVAAHSGHSQPQSRRLRELEPALQELVRQSRELGLSGDLVLERLEAAFNKKPQGDGP